jgi:biopolymer transport protein ExbD
MRRRRRGVPANIPTASMADIAFLLIVFFMITTKFQVDKQQVELPATVEREEILAESAFISIKKRGEGEVRAVNSSEVFFSDGVEISKPVSDLDELRQRIGLSVTQRPGNYFVIQADQDVPYETFDLVREALRDSGASRVTFLSKQKIERR